MRMVGSTAVAARRRWLVATGGLLLGLWTVVAVAAPTPAAAHAVLISASPADDDALDTPPSEVRLTFNEPIVVDDGALRVLDTDAERVDEGPVDGDEEEVAVALPDDLPDGAYVAVYRVVSADSHPIAGVLTFTVGDAERLDQAAIDDIAGPGTGTIGAVGSVLRGTGYVATLLAAGAVVFAVAVARGPADRRRAERVARPVAIAGVVVTLLHLPVQAAAVSGYGPFEVLGQSAALAATVTSGFGLSAIARATALAALATPWFVGAPAGGSEGRGSARGTSRPLLWLGAAAAVALGSYLLDGHQRTVEPTWLLVGGDAIHLAAGAAWFGGLVLLVATLRAAREADDPVGAATAVARFSRLALWSVAALTLAGVAMSVPLVRGFDALTTTAYGTLLMTKVGLVALVVAVAAYNRRQLVPAVVARAVPAGGSADVADAPAAPTIAAWSHLSRTVQIEAALLVAVLGVTGFLVTTQPAAEAAGLTGPVSVDAQLTEDVTVDFTVDPGEAGLNTIHLYAFDDTGQLTDQLDDLRLEFTQIDDDIGPFVVEPFVAGPGHWTATIDDLRFAGRWEARVVAGLGRFDEVDVTLPFELH